MSRVRCGIEPKYVIPVWEFTTGEIRAFLQKQFNKLTKGLREGKDEDGNPDPKWADLDDIEISLVMTKLSKKYVAFYLILPTSVIKGSKSMKKVDAIFRQDQDDNHIAFEDPIYDLVSALMYTKNERIAFRTEAGKRAFLLGRREAGFLWRFLTPHLTRIEDNKGHEEKYIAIAIDPLRVFREMISDTLEINKNRNTKKDSDKVEYPFKTYIKTFRNLDKGNFVFEVRKVPIQKDNSNFNITESFNRSLRMAVEKDDN